MAVTVATLIKQTRRMLRDYPQQQTILNSITSSASSFTAAVTDDMDFIFEGQVLELDQETLMVFGTSGSVVSIRRGAKGTTAATHAAGASYFVSPKYQTAEIVDALNFVKDEMYPQIYISNKIATTTTAVNTYEYSIPTMLNGAGGSATYETDLLPMPFVSRVEIKYVGEADYREVRNYRILRGFQPKIKLDDEPPMAGATLRFIGYGPFEDLLLATSLDPDWPHQATSALVLGTVSWLLAGMESERANQFASQDLQTWANLQGPGAAILASEKMYQRYQRALANAVMPKMPPHVKPTF